MKQLRLLLVLVVALSAPAYAEMEKLAVLCENKICFNWWPKLPAVKGWHHERDHSYKYSVNAQAPDGYTFANAEFVIYAKALYKPRIPETKSLEMLIKDDKKQFLSQDSNIVITEVEPLATGDGKIMKSFTFFPKQNGNWERVSYGEEGDFYLVFTISSRTKEGYTRAVEDYKQFVSHYKEKP
jgi:hypothetical protein